MTAAEDSVTATVDDTLTLGCTANAKPTPDEVRCCEGVAVVLLGNTGVAR